MLDVCMLTLALAGISFVLLVILHHAAIRTEANNGRHDIVRCVRVLAKRWHAPLRASDGASGYDLIADIQADVHLAPGERYLFGTGVYVEIPAGYEGQVRPRSGLAIKQGITVLNSPGTIDSDYRGEIKVILINTSDDQRTVRPGDRIAQLVLAPIASLGLVFVDDIRLLEKTGRGIGGFGSTNGKEL
jgi:dUTP pyrophosphatase